MVPLLENGVEIVHKCSPTKTTPGYGTFQLATGPLWTPWQCDKLCHYQTWFWIHRHSWEWRWLLKTRLSTNGHGGLVSFVTDRGNEPMG